MYTRVVELNVKSGKVADLASTINQKVLPILRKQAGFIEETVLVGDALPNRVLALSFWNTKDDAERYHREQYPAIGEVIRPLLESTPVVATFNVDTSTAHKIAAGKAA
ncbi:MAG TPA: antibiotic biosynthesis monooxygenase [Terriglobales bacterium]|nr:antibiotic biosynthesis monooxygenase [Terriglobales bacterium]